MNRQDIQYLKEQERMYQRRRDNFRKAVESARARGDFKEEEKLRRIWANPMFQDYFGRGKKC